MKETPVREIMSSNLATLSPFDTLATASDVFSSRKIHHIPIIHEDKLVGILSNTDLERCKPGKSLFVNHNVDQLNESVLEVTLISSVMTEVVESVRASDSFHDVYLIFKQNHFRSLPVFDGDELVGIVTPMDFLDYFFNQ